MTGPICTNHTNFTILSFNLIYINEAYFVRLKQRSLFRLMLLSLDILIMILFIFIIFQICHDYWESFFIFQYFRQLSHSHFHNPLILLILLLGCNLITFLMCLLKLYESLFELLDLSTRTL
jgi:hypothetical protein